MSTVGSPQRIGVLVVDDHPAVRAGLRALVEAEPGMTALGEVGDTFSVAPAVYRMRPDVVVLDYQLPGVNGLSLCREITAGVMAPAVLVYSAFASRALTVPARIARAGAIADKGIEASALTSIIRRLAAGERLIADPSPDLVAAAAHRLSPEDAPVLELILSGAAVADVAERLGIPPVALERRVDRMLARLTVTGCPG